MSSAPSVITQVAHTKLEACLTIYFHLIKKKEKEKSHINNLQFEQPYSSILIQILNLYAIG